jgi:hypothetical protein
MGIMDIGEEEEVIEVPPGISIPAEWPADAPSEPAPNVEPESEPVPA